MGHVEMTKKRFSTKAGTDTHTFLAAAGRTARLQQYKPLQIFWRPERSMMKNWGWGCIFIRNKDRPELGKSIFLLNSFWKELIYRTGPGSETTAGTRKVNFPFKLLLKTIDFSDGPWIWDHVETMLEARRGANGRKETRSGWTKRLDIKSLQKQESW